MKLLNALSSEIEIVRQFVEVGATYAHYRNPDLHYVVIAVALQEASEEVCIIYQALYGDHLIWVRNFKNWQEEIEHQGQRIKRFQKVAFIKKEK